MPHRSRLAGFIIDCHTDDLDAAADFWSQALGCRVAVTAGSRNKLELCAELGAEITIDYHSEDFVEAVRAAGGADVILDIMGAADLDRNFDALAADLHRLQRSRPSRGALRAGRGHFSILPVVWERTAARGCDR